MAMMENDTPDASKRLLHPGMVIAENFSYEGIRSTLWKLYVIIMEFLPQKENVGHEDNVGWCLSLVVASRTMPPKRRRVPTQDVDLAAQMNELRQMMLAQRQEIRGLRAQLAQQNQGPPDAEVPPAPVNQPAASEILDVDPVIPKNPIAPEILVAPVAVPPAPLFRQGNLSVAEAVKKFEQLARLCPHLISSERDKVRRMMRMFRSNLAVDKTRNKGLSSSRKRGKKRPKLSRTRPDQAKLHNKKVKEDLRVKTTTTSSTATTNRRGSGMQEDRGINKIFPKRRMLLITIVIPLVRNVGGGTREIAVLEPVAAFYMARKATMLELAISIPRIRRINREDRDLNFTLHR
ncbi:hypothetical protein TIFTF001_047077 [Ficus carica]|uniref:Uncharacterized protein n=1 Tax=Ficus carica TaxID=3494 RepID=A0AA88CL10_FICCA|nr:hypothetical protein TIFTF001_047077 [Ficus carica]